PKQSRRSSGARASRGFHGAFPFGRIADADRGPSRSAWLLPRRAPRLGVGNLIDEDHARLCCLDLSTPVSPGVARGIEFAGRLALETRQDCTAWLDLLSRLSPAGAHGSWRRQGLLAIVRSEIGLELLERCSAVLLVNGGALFTELSTTIVAVETVPTADLYTAMKMESEKPIPRSLRTNTTGTGTRLLRWVLQHPQEVPIQAIGAVIDLIEIQIQLLMIVPTLAGPAA